MIDRAFRYLRRRSPLAFLREEDGVAATEFAIIAPVLLSLWMGFAGVGMGLRVADQINEAADVMGDMAGRTSEYTDDKMNGIMNAAQAIILDVPADDVQLHVAVLQVDSSGVPRQTAAKSRNGAPSYANNTSYADKVPEKLHNKVEGTRLIRAHAKYDYTPPFGAGIIGTLKLDYVRYYSPRQ